MPDALDRSIIEIYVRNLQTIGKRIRQYRKIVVLACDLDLAGREITNRMIAAVMAELKPPRLRSAGNGQELMPKTDSE